MAKSPNISHFPVYVSVLPEKKHFRLEIFKVIPEEMKTEEGRECRRDGDGDGAELGRCIIALEEKVNRSEHGTWKTIIQIRSFFIAPYYDYFMLISPYKSPTVMTYIERRKGNNETAT